MTLLPTKDDEYFMQQALQQAEKAWQQEEVPVGAVVVCQSRIIAKAHNQTQLLQDATAHAEMIALTAAQHYLSSRYLKECSLYVSVEPCVMCAGAISWTQLKEVIWATADEKHGYSLYQPSLLHKRCVVREGVGQVKAQEFMQKAFQNIRNRKKLVY